MKLEKRGAAAPEPEESQQPGEEAAPQTPKTGGKKPVIVYIMVLFIVAFLLMALSFLMHQRSNTEVLGELHSNVNAIQELQNALEENMRLEQEVQDLQEQVESQENEITGYGDSIAHFQSQLDALEGLYTLQQQYAAKNYDGCRKTIEDMESAGSAETLKTLEISDVTAPAQRYQELKAAVEQR